MVRIPWKSSSADTSADLFEPSFTRVDGIKVIIQKRNWIVVWGPWIRMLALGRSRICHLREGTSKALMMMAFVEWTCGNCYSQILMALTLMVHPFIVLYSSFPEKFPQTCTIKCIVMPFTHFLFWLLLFISFSLSRFAQELAHPWFNPLQIFNVVSRFI